MSMDFIRKLLPNMSPEHQELALQAMAEESKRLLAEDCPVNKLLKGSSYLHSVLDGHVLSIASLEDPYLITGALHYLLGRALFLRATAVGMSGNNGPTAKEQESVFDACESQINGIMDDFLRYKGYTLKTEWENKLPGRRPVS